jgi:hypothetical protein
MELFEDDRFLFDLNDRQKGLYLMLLALAGKTNNAIRNEAAFIKNRLGLSDLNMDDIEIISGVYPKLKLKGGYWGFENFQKTHNYILGKYEGTPSELQRSSQNKNKKENKNKNKKENSSPRRTGATITDQDFIETLKANQAYKHIDITNELAKMDAWLSTRHGRQKTRLFVVNWLNKIDPPVAGSAPTTRVLPKNLQNFLHGAEQMRQKKEEQNEVKAIDIR